MLKHGNKLYWSFNPRESIHRESRYARYSSIAAEKEMMTRIRTACINAGGLYKFAAVEVETSVTTPIDIVNKPEEGSLIHSLQPTANLWRQMEIEDVALCDDLTKDVDGADSDGSLPALMDDGTSSESSSSSSSDLGNGDQQTNDMVAVVEATTLIEVNVHPEPMLMTPSGRKDTPHPNVGILLGDIEECHLPEAEVSDGRPDLSALTMLGDVCQHTRADTRANEASSTELKYSEQPKHDTAAGAVEAKPKEVEWPAVCAHSDCPCSSSCNGQPGEHCSLACRNGRTCTANNHTVPYTSGVMGQRKSLFGDDIKPVPRNLPYRVCCCWLGCKIQLNAREIEDGDDL